MKTLKHLSVLFAVLLVVSLAVVGFAVSAEDATVITVTNEAEFNAAMVEANNAATIVLKNDITLTGGNTTMPGTFTGTFDGGKKTIKGITAPLFTTLSGEVKDLTLEGAINETTLEAVGAVAQTAGSAATVTNVTNKVNVTASGSVAKYVGGFIGYVSGTNSAAFVNCTNDGTVSSASSATYGVGGFVGLVNGDTSNNDNKSHAVVTIERSVNSGTIEATAGSGSYGAAGFVGTGDAYTITITESLNKGDITSSSNYAAGFYAATRTWNNKAYGDIFTATYCGNTGTITAKGSGDASGGIVGKIGRSQNGCYTFAGCYNTGKLVRTQTAGAVSGIVGYTNSKSGLTLHISNCYNVGEMTGGGSRHAMGSMNSISIGTNANNFYYGTTATSTSVSEACEDLDDFIAKVTALEGIYLEDEDDINGGYPILAWQKGVETPIRSVTFGDVLYNEYESGWVNTQTEEKFTLVKDGDTYMVGDANRYAVVMAILGASENVTLTNNIDLLDGSSIANVSYAGTFDGAGYTISGISNIMFNAIAGGTVKNVTLYGNIISENRKAATITYDMNGGSITNVVSYVNVTVSAYNLNAGGIVGYALGANTFTNVTYAGTLNVNWTGTNGGAVGGIVGYTNVNHYTNSIEYVSCAFTGTINVSGSPANTLWLGGMLGRGRYTNNFTDCVSTGTITVDTPNATTTDIGGFVGEYATDADNSTILGGYVNATLPEGASTFCGDLSDVSEDSVTAYTAETAVKYHDTFVVDGVTYQEYNFGYLNVATSWIVSGIESPYHVGNAAVVENNVAPDCTNAGSYDNVVYCECGKELSRTTVPVDATGHTEGTAVTENEVASDCKTAGHYDSVVYCTVCNAELSRTEETIAIDPTNHAGDAVTYTNDGTTHSAVYDCCQASYVTGEAHTYGDDHFCVCTAKEPAGWVKKSGYWYYLDPVTYEKATGIARVPYPTVTVNSKTYAPDAETIAYCASKGTTFIDAETALFMFDENGKFKVGFTGLTEYNGATRYVVNGFLVWHPGFVEVDGELYYFIGDVDNGGNKPANGDTYITRVNGFEGFAVNDVYFFENGKLVVDMEGIVDGKYYEGSQIAFGKGLVEIDGNYYYITSSGEIVKNTTYWIEKTNGLPVMAYKQYTFDENGCLTNPIFTTVNGIIDGCYYVDGAIVYGAGLIEIDGAYYYVRSNGQIATGKTWVTNTNGIVPQGWYVFDENGATSMDSIVVQEDGIHADDDGVFHYYENGSIVYGAGLIEIDGAYYYVRSNGVVATGRVWVTNTNGIVAEQGWFNFDADGKLIIE